jgi:HK97 gp10 family phage protein
MALAKAPIEVTGLKQLGETLRALDDKMIKKVVRKGLRAGAKVTLAAVRADAPKRTGTMARAFAVSGGRQKNKGTIGVQVAVGKKWFVGDQFYAGFQEFGWSVGKRTTEIVRHQERTRKGKKSLFTDTRRRIPGKHFVEQAAERTAEAAVAAIVETIRAEIDKAVEESKKGA